MRVFLATRICDAIYIGTRVHRETAGYIWYVAGSQTHQAVSLYNVRVLAGPPVPFHLHTELAYQIKLALYSSRRSDPDTRVEVPFDYFLFVGGLKQAGTLLKTHHGHDVYGIKMYHNLVPILGTAWHVRVLNKQMDFCYVILHSVHFHLHHQQDIADFHPDLYPQHSVHGGYAIILSGEMASRSNLMILWNWNRVVVLLYLL